MQDVEWWLRDKLQQQNYSTWFQPDVTIVMPGSSPKGSSPTGEDVIDYGDVLHVDFGVTALGMNTDVQHLAYVLYPGETEKDVPRGLLEGLKKVNRLQDIVKENMGRAIGTTGNQILKASLDQMESEGIKGKIYSHPIGDWGHSAGTLIGMFYCPIHPQHVTHRLHSVRNDQSARRGACSRRPPSLEEHLLQCGALCRAFRAGEECNHALLPRGGCLLGQ